MEIYIECHYIECDNTESVYELKDWDYTIYIHSCLPLEQQLFLWTPLAHYTVMEKALITKLAQVSQQINVVCKALFNCVNEVNTLLTYLMINYLERMAYEVFLGGSCNPTTWRSDIAIPTLQNLGITYYNPVSSLSSVSFHNCTHARYRNWIIYRSKCHNGVRN